MHVANADRAGKKDVGFDSSMPADGTHSSALDPNGNFGMSRLRAVCSESRIPRFTFILNLSTFRQRHYRELLARP
jgi:hypothetical protein